jgi:hypothetical protein
MCVANEKARCIAPAKLPLCGFKAAKSYINYNVLREINAKFARSITGPVVQLDRISDFGSEGWGFESSRVHLKVQKQTSLLDFYFIFHFPTGNKADIQ